MEGTKPEWSKTDVEALISKYESYPSLWDTQSEDYRNRPRKREAWKALAFEFNTTEAEVQRKIHNLRNQFSQELKKPGKRKPGEDVITPYRSKWPHFEALQFIRGLVVCRRTPRNRRPTARAIQKQIKAETSNHDSYDLQDDNVENGHEEEEDEEEEGGGGQEWERGSSRNKPYQQPPPTATQPKGSKRSSGASNELVNENLMLKKARSLACHEPDQYDTFGAFVACEIRSLQFNSNKIKLKRIIQNAILDIAESEEEQLEHSDYNSSFQIPAVTYSS